MDPLSQRPSWHDVAFYWDKAPPFSSGRSYLVPSLSIHSRHTLVAFSAASPDAAHLFLLGLLCRYQCLSERIINCVNVKSLDAASEENVEFVVY